ncbi:DEAD/DEAH box helicase [bacterium]|nr:DEAD/DEAH box helicase [bacterium]
MINGKTYHRRSARRHFSKRGDSTKKGAYDNPRLDPQLKQTFKKIGVPESTPFKPDPFQLEALDRIKDFDVLVSAPTGSGKTWIASQAISQYHARGLRSWYASPLKALSNSIYLEFSHEFGAGHCGILTGDRKENPDAPIVVGTTEILRNQLYDSMHEGTSIQADLVILDEAHYLSDPDRGVVWEEVLIYLPSRVRLLLLSATISNAEEICTWLEENRGTPARVVLSDERPVPLEMLFLFPDGLISPLGGKKGLTPRVKKFFYPQGVGRRRRGSRKVDFGDMIKCLRALDLLPAIFFLKSRMDCDRALLSCTEADKPAAQKERLKRDVTKFLLKYPHLDGHRQLGSLLHAMVGAHHAGQFPYWKVLIEKMMNQGYLEAIFSTSTVAAGVNFPARTVVLVQSDRFNGHEFMDLTATDLHQMTGRAGRRGKDNIGFALVVPGLHQDPQLIYELKDSSPEPLMSQIHINFSMTLNLLLSHTPSEVKDLLNRSFASFQEKKTGSSVQKKWDDLLNVLRSAIPTGKCDTSDPYEVMDNIQKKAELKRITRNMAREIQNENLLNAYREHLKPGRLFLHKNGGVYVLFQTTMDRGRMICAAHNVQKAVRARKRNIRLQKVPFDKIRVLYDYRLSLPDDISLGRLQGLFDAINTKDLEVLKIDPEKMGDGSEKIVALKERLGKLPCEDCENDRLCHTTKNKALRKTLNDLRALAIQMEGMGGGLWVSFKRHVRFLMETGFVDEADRLTPDGLWASKLRLDQPLLIAEAIRKGGFHGLEPEIMAGCIAPFVWDRVQELDLKGESPINLRKCEEAFYRILDQIGEISRLKAKRGFENPPILFWPGAALFLWARGVPWDRILYYIPVDEGDMASLIVRTADHLRQVTNLRATHPELASVARRAIDLILREPVLIE